MYNRDCTSESHRKKGKIYPRKRPLTSCDIFSTKSGSLPIKSYSLYSHAIGQPMKSFPDITALYDVFQIMAQVLPSDGNILNVICGIAIHHRAVHYSALGTPDVTEDQFLHTVGGMLLFSLFSTGRHEIADY